MRYACIGMRCPACSTENTPDSRFCGRCGAKLVSEPRLAPTAKIPDDAPLPAQAAVAGAPYAGGGPISYAPPQMPPAAALPSPAPTATPVPAAPAPIRRVPEASVSLPEPPRRRTGLVAAVLVIDLALAGTGAFLLAKGVAPPKPAARPVTPSVTPIPDSPTPSPPGHTP